MTDHIDYKYLEKRLAAAMSRDRDGDYDGESAAIAKLFVDMVRSLSRIAVALERLSAPPPVEVTPP